MDSQTGKNVKEGGKPDIGECPEELLTRQELARKLRVSHSKLRDDGDLPCVRYGRNIRYSWPEVVAYLRSQTV